MGRRRSRKPPASPYDIVVLDLMLPDIGWRISVCRQLRASGHMAPILMLTARDGVSATALQGLNAGADDYLSKPSNSIELVARIRALLRRQPRVQHPTIRIADLVIDTHHHQVSRAGIPIPSRRGNTRCWNILRHVKARCVAAGPTSPSTCGTNRTIRLQT